MTDFTDIWCSVGGYFRHYTHVHCYVSFFIGSSTAEGSPVRIPIQPSSDSDQLDAQINLLTFCKGNGWFHNSQVRTILRMRRNMIMSAVQLTHLIYTAYMMVFDQHLSSLTFSSNLLFWNVTVNCTEVINTNLGENLLHRIQKIVTNFKCWAGGIQQVFWSFLCWKWLPTGGWWKLLRANHTFNV